MKIVKSIDITESDYLSKTTKDYLLGKSDNKIFPANPSLQLIYDKSLKKNFSKDQRKNLVEILLSQYKKDNIQLTKTSKVYKNITSLENENIFTCTTGQQIHIFLGPLFFIYKVKSLLKLVKLFNDKNYSTKAVPVFWMASEDHDLDEISFVKLYGKEFRWNTESGNAVGRINCKGLPELIAELENRADKTPENEKLYSLLKKYYNSSNTLSAATRGILHELFEESGLIILNPDDTELKKNAIDIFEKELENKIIYNTAKEQYSLLKKEGYKPVLNPQKVNYFWLENDKRYKIKESDEGEYELSGKRKITKQEILKSPEKLSPNVLARPIYQEVILPNIVYVAGSTEIEYWLLLTHTFQNFGIQFPVLMLRDSAFLLNEKIYNAIKKLKLSPDDFLMNQEVIIKKINNKTNNKLNKIDKKLYNVVERINQITSEMILLGFEKSKVEEMVKDIKSDVIKLKNNSLFIEQSIAFDKNISESIIKIKNKFFNSKQERIYFFIEYPELFNYLSMSYFTEFESKLYFISK